MFTLQTELSQIKQIQKSYLEKLHKLDLKTIKDLLYHFPHRYEDFRKITPISQLKLNQKVTIRGKILEATNQRTFRRRMVLTEVIIDDQTGLIKAIWFNQPFLLKTLRPGREIILSGKVNFSDEGIYLSNPVYEIAKEARLPIHTGRLVPIYPETAGLSSRYIRFLIKKFLPLTKQIEDFLPSSLRKDYQLLDLKTALNQVHFPDNLALAEKARQRLAFDEFFLIQLYLLKQKYQFAQQKSYQIPFNQPLIKSFVEKLPFKLTDSQRVAAWEIFQDLEKTRPMNRLLNGDVGSGKTIVAIMASLATAKAGYQVAIMAPTEVLARQHFQTFTKFLQNEKLKIALLTRADHKFLNKNQIISLSAEKIKKMILNGQIDLVIGTHSLIQEKINFKNLALAIVDEQHRFGVRQRASLLQKSTLTPHLLSMTATPIPRTLALTLYGDLDISLIKELPQGRQKIITQVIPPAEREKAYQLIRKEIKNGRQAFVICPLIEDSPKLEVKSVTQEYEKLSQEVFPEFKIALLHGQLKAKEKEKIMKDFLANKINLLISTSVVEVGVDVPNATVMMIEDADRFGLAQLHQFRGRVGRGPYQSYCLLFTESTAKRTHQRLKALLTAKDGFELAEKDLQIRGPGDFVGTRQWGLPDLAMASFNDLPLIQKARQAARKVIEENLWTPLLSQKLTQFQKQIHLE